ncbi:MAG: hypothetical protein KTR16_17270 [Acidiferrobacterales bacterium]|nr:hypothetical protein [Acidiferrobacterales bacterium]
MTKTQPTGCFCMKVVFVLLFCLINQTLVRANDTKQSSVNIAFAGGGWRAHAGHSAWTMSLLQNGDKKLHEVFAKVGAISSNSGGSWFNTMLAYSGDFVNAVEARDALQDWATPGVDASGWLGQQQTLFADTPCGLLKGDFFLECVSAYYTNGIKNATYWHKVVEKVVFRDHVLAKPLSSPRQPWAESKALLLAGSMLTTEAVLSEHGINKQYYQACFEPSKPILDGNKGASCEGETKSADVTPVTFASLPNDSNLKTPPFLSALGEERKANNLNVGYTENAYLSPAKANTTIGNPLVSDSVPIMTAAAASSAATGFATSAIVSGVWEVSYLASDESLHFALDDEVQHIDAKAMKVAELATNKIVQIADGGAVDNSAVAQLVSFLQLNNQADEFNIVAFNHVQNIYQANKDAGKVGIDIANLFGKGLSTNNQVCSGPDGSGFCVTVPELQIFDEMVLATTPVTWSAQADTHSPPDILNEIIYTKYQVTTIDNSNYGIKAGSTGTLHAFTTAWSNANTAPKGNAVDFKAYADMLNFIGHGLHKANAQGQTGFNFLNQAFGIID